MTVKVTIEDKEFEFNEVELTKKYVSGIKRLGGAKRYYFCGEQAAAKGKAIYVAACLKAAKKKLTERDWGKAWSRAVFGVEVDVGEIGGGEGVIEIK